MFTTPSILLNSLSGFSPSVNFMMMPLHADLLRIQTIEFNDRIRKSHFTFEIHGDNIKLYPAPGTLGTQANQSYGKVWIEFLFEEEKAKDEGRINKITGAKVS